MKTPRYRLACLLLQSVLAVSGCDFMADSRTCDRPQTDPNATVAACTRLIESHHLNTVALAGVLTNRAAAWFNLHQFDKAMADLDAAIQAKPDFAIAWARRSGLHAMRGELDEALSDVLRAIALNPRDINARLTEAQILERKHDYTGEMSVLDAAIVEWPDEPIPVNNRCWARATHDTELDLALADCNAALRLKPDAPNTLDSRGFTYLRMGRYNEAIRDYDAAIAHAPRMASSFYGRGMARRALGDSAGSVSDINSAKALSADVVREFQGYGIDP